MSTTDRARDLAAFESDSVALDLKQHLTKLDVRKIKYSRVDPRQGPFTEERNCEVFKVR